MDVTVSFYMSNMITSSLLFLPQGQEKNSPQIFLNIEEYFNTMIITESELNSRVAPAEKW